MQKNSTLLLNEKRSMASAAKPKKSTIEFLKQFARAYSYEPRMPYRLGSFIAN